MNKKIMWGVVAILVIVVFAFYFSNYKEATTPTDTSAWKTSKGNASGISFKYPATLGTTYINTVDWPPKIQVQNTAFKCAPAGTETAQAGQTTKETIDGRDYCVTKETEGAAGSIYTQYAYGTELQNKMVFFTFTLRSVQCANYPDPQKTACENERATFMIDPVIDQIVQTVTSQ